MLRLDIKKILIEQAKECLDIKELSQRSKIPRATLISILNGKRNARPKTIGMLAKVLNIDVQEIIVQDEKK